MSDTDDIDEETLQANARLASLMMGLAVEEVSKRRDALQEAAAVTPDNYHAYVQAHMSAQVQLLGQDQLKDIETAVHGIDASGACPDLSTLESVTRRGLDEIKDSISELDGTCSAACDQYHKSLTADTSDAVNELRKVRRELAKTKKALNAKSEDVAERDELDEIDQLLQRQQLSHAELVQELEVAKAKCTQFEEEAALHKEDRERLEDAKRKLKSSAEQFDRLRTDYLAEKGKVDKLKAELAEMTLYKEDEYCAAQALEMKLEEEQRKCCSYVAQRDAARYDLSTAKAELVRYKALADANHDKWQCAKKDSQYRLKLAQDVFTKWKATEAEPEPDSDPEPVMCSTMGTGKSLRAERARTLFPPDISDACSAADAKCANSGVLPGATSEEDMVAKVALVNRPVRTIDYVD